MSYIRATSNPEGLYVWGSSDEQRRSVLNFSSFHIKGDTGISPLMYCWTRDFHELIDRMQYSNDIPDDGRKCRNIRLLEGSFILATGKKQKFVSYKPEDIGKSDWRVKLSIGNKFILLYATTWAYLFNGVKERNALAKKVSRKRIKSRTKRK